MTTPNLYDTCLQKGYIEHDELLQCVTFEFQETQDILISTTNVFFLIYAASLVFFMQTGFAMICSGCVRQNNVQNTMLKNLLDVCGSALAYFSVGYAFSYGDDREGKTFIGNRNFFLSDMEDDRTGGTYSIWLFHFAFAATSATIVAGTLAERCQMRAYLLYSMILTGFVYPVVAHNIWSPNGFLSSKSVSEPLLGIGMIDFAGSGVVHVTGGCTALVATFLLGPRRGRFYDESGERLEEPKTFPGHSKSLQMLGTLILWFGWYGFNAGSAVDIESDLKPLVTAIATVNTTLSAAAAGVTALLINVLYTERMTGEAIFNLSAAMNGCLSGLAAITASCGVIEPWAATIVGIIAGVVYLLASAFLERNCLDDAVNAIPVHLFSGIWGVISVGLFASPRGMNNFLGKTDHVGIFYSWSRGSSDASLLACQLIGLLSIIGWTTSIMCPFFVILNYCGMFRADSLEEIVGLDVSYHGFNRSYVGEGITEEMFEAYESERGNKMSKHGIQRFIADKESIEEKLESGGVDRVE